MADEEQFLKTIQEWTEIFMHRSMHNIFLFSKDCGLTMSQFGALFQIRTRGRMGVSDVGDDLGVTSAAASQMLERLVQQGFITRSEDPDDRRVKQIVLTEKGSQLLHQSVQARQEWLKNLATMMTKEESKQVINGLQILIEKTHQLETLPQSE